MERSISKFRILIGDLVIKIYRKKLLIICFIVGIATSLFLLFFQSAEESVVDEYTKTEQNNEVSEWLNKVNNPAKRNQATIYKNKKKFERIVEASENSLMDINLHGKVVDQNENPVPGVLVQFGAHSAYLARGSSSQTVTTDSNGYFSTHGAKGAGISIFNVEKKGYEFRISYINDPAMRRISFDNIKKHPTSLLWQDYSRESPYILRMWKIEQYPKLRQNDTKFKFKPDGTEYTLDFTSKSRPTPEPGRTVGDIKVTFVTEDNNWSLHLSAVEGGLLESEDVYMNLAPEFGYQKSIEYSYEKGELAGDHKLVNLFFKSRNGQVYGRLHMDIRPYQRKRSAIYLTYIVNAHGSRNLLSKEY